MKKQELINKLIRDRDYYMDAESHKRKTIDGFIKLVKQLEPEITEEQAWNKIAETVPLSLPELKGVVSRAGFNGLPDYKLELPVIPQFVADWFEKNKNNLELNIFSLIVGTYGSCNDSRTKIQEWANWEKNKPIEILIKMKDGYIIESPKNYRVKVSNELYFVRYDELEVVVIRDNAPGFIERAKVFDNKEEAKKVADNVNGYVEKLSEGEAMKSIEGWKK